MAALGRARRAPPGPPPAARDGGPARRVPGAAGARRLRRHGADDRGFVAGLGRRRGSPRDAPPRRSPPRARARPCWPCCCPRGQWLPAVDVASHAIRRELPTELADRWSVPPAGLRASRAASGRERPARVAPPTQRSALRHDRRAAPGVALPRDRTARARGCRPRRRATTCVDVGARGRRRRGDARRVRIPRAVRRAGARRGAGGQPPALPVEGDADPGLRLRAPRGARPRCGTKDRSRAHGGGRRRLVRSRGTRRRGGILGPGLPWAFAWNLLADRPGARSGRPALGGALRGARASGPARERRAPQACAAPADRSTRAALLLLCAVAELWLAHNDLHPTAPPEAARPRPPVLSAARHERRRPARTSTTTPSSKGRRCAASA